MDLTRRGLLNREPAGYLLGPELRRVGERAALQHAFAGQLPLLEELRARFGRMAWLIAGSDATAMELLNLPCERGFAPTAFTIWPALLARSSTLTNSAGGRLLLAERPDLIEAVARQGMSPTTPYSPRNLGDLDQILHRVRAERIALESEHLISGWTCAAIRVPDTNGYLAVLGVAVHVSRTTSSRLLRTLGQALSDPAAPGPVSRGRQRR